MHPLEHKVEQTLIEIDRVKSTLSEHLGKLESLIKHMEGQHEVQQLLVEQTLKKLTKHQSMEKTDSEVQGRQEEVNLQKYCILDFYPSTHYTHHSFSVRKSAGKKT